MALLQISEEQRKLLEGSDAGKAILASLENTEKELTAKLSESDAKLGAAMKAKKELEDSLLNPELIAALSQTRQGKRQPAQADPEAEENLDELPPSKIATKLRAEWKAAGDSFRDEVKEQFGILVKSVTGAFHQMQLEALEDLHGEPFVKNKKDLEAFCLLPENQQLRPRAVYAKFMDKLELEAKRKADLAVVAAEAARQKELESYAENPEGGVPPGATGEKKVPGDAFDAAWAKTPGAEKLLRPPE